VKHAALLLAAVFLFQLAAQEKPRRPRITGIDHVRLYISTADKAREFYTKFLDLPSRGGGCRGLSHPCYPVNSLQQIETQLVPSPAPQNWLAEVAFRTDDIVQMRRYLLAHSVGATPISKDANGVRHFELRDPEGNPIAFIQRWECSPDWLSSGGQVGRKILHAGFVVKNTAAENRFYVDLLGFRLYWYGGFKDDGVDWYEIQVPDGDNWIEYMLNIPAKADHKELGVQNHFSLGVENAQSAAALLHANGLKSFDGPEVGRDGKNSLDAYDPDGTRVEVTEFTPAQKPCCHPYSAPHPTP
jgi:catechol 2,3-dioxygenase-like lactoylglutathione lyase family enzyme